MLALCLSLVAARNSHAQLATSSWPSFRHDPGLSGRATVNGPTDPVVYWTKQVGVGSNLSPVVAEDGTIVFTSTRHGVLYACNPDGSFKWEYRINDGLLDAPGVMASDQKIHIGSFGDTAREFFSIQSNGTLDWRKPASGDISNPANIDGFGNIYFVTNDAKLYSLHPDGTEYWQATFHDNESPNGPPAIDTENRIYVPAGKHVYIYNALGTLLRKWSDSAVDEIGWVITNNERVYVGSQNKPVVAVFDRTNPVKVDTFSYKGHDADNVRYPCFPAIGKDNSLIFTDSNIHLMLALTADLKFMWSKRESGRRFETMPVVDNAGRIYVVSNDSRYGLLAISTDSGNIIWAMPQVRCKQQNCSTDCARSLAFGADGTIYVPTSDTLYAVRQRPRAQSLEFVSSKDLFFCYDSLLQTELRVVVKNQYGEPFKDHPVTFRIQPNGPEFVDTTLADGIARFNWHLEKKAGMQSVKVTSAGTQPDLIFTAHIAASQISGPNWISFGTLLVSRDTSKTITVKNMSRCRLRMYRPLIATNPDNVFSLLGTYQDSTVLDSSEALTVEVKFKPHKRGDYTGTLLLRNSDPDRPNFEITLHGIARAPEIFVAPSALPFGTVCLDESRTLNTLTVTNKGDTTLHVAKPDFSDNTAFTSPDTGFVLGPDSSRNIPVTFKPTAEKNYAGATLTLTHDDRSKPAVVIPLSGVGATDSISGLREMKFDTTALHDSTNTRPYQIHAASACALRIDTIEVAGEGFKCLTCDSLRLPFEIPAGHDTTLWIRFWPRTHGAKTGKMKIKNGDPQHNLFEVDLKGFGRGEPKIAVADSLLLFPETCVGLTRVDSVLIRSTGSAPLVVTGFSPPTDTAFTIKSSGFTLEPGDSAFVRVCFSPYRQRNYTASFQIFSNAGTFEVGLSGTATWPEIMGDTVLTFDSTWVCQSSTKGYGVRKESGSCELLLNTPPIIIGPHAGDFTMVAENLCANYPPQSAFRFCLRFTPQDSGWRTAQLKIESNAEPLTVTLRGYGKPDTLAPGAPVNIAIKPSGWSRVDGFTLTWTNPRDTCGIAAAYYQIGDGKIRERVRYNIDSLVVTATEPGSYPVHVWLKDKRGNANDEKHATVVIQFDNLPPRFDHHAKEFAPVDKAIEIHAEAVEPAQESGVDPAKFQLLYSPGGKSLKPSARKIFLNGMAIIPPDSVTPRGVEYAIEAQDSAGNMARWPNRVPGFHSIKIQLSPGRIETTQAGGEGQEYYRVRSLPFEAEEKNAAKVFPTNFVRKKIARAWDIDSTLVVANSNFPFREYEEQANFTDMRPGHAILLITAKDITLRNGAGHTVRTDEDFLIDVRPGWNLIASPFYFEIPLQNLTPKFPDAELYHFIDGEWRAASSLPLFKLQPWEGYAIKIGDAAPRALRLHPSEYDTTRALPQLAKPNWTIRMSASCEQAYDRNNVIGVAEGAAVEWDEYEMLEPPRHADYVALYFPQEHWQAQPELYATDFRPPTSAGYEWRFRVETNLHGEEVILRFDNLASVPRAYEVYLRDEQSARVISLRQERQYSFRTSSIGSIYDFRVLVGDTAFVRSELPQSTSVAAAYELLPNYPNPFNPATNIAFALPQPERVSLVIYDVKGRAVRTLLDNAEKSAGYHAAVWNGKDDHGTEAASGLYFVRLQAGDYVLTRKLAFVK